MIIYFLWSAKSFFWKILSAKMKTHITIAQVYLIIRLSIMNAIQHSCFSDQADIRLAVSHTFEVFTHYGPGMPVRGKSQPIQWGYTLLCIQQKANRPNKTWEYAAAPIISETKIWSLLFMAFMRGHRSACLHTRNKTQLCKNPARSQRVFLHEVPTNRRDSLSTGHIVRLHANLTRCTAKKSTRSNPAWQI